METESLLKPPASRALKSGRVRLAPGEEIGEHVTHMREELVFVLEGIATLIKEGEEIELKQGQAHFIKEEVNHNIRNNSSADLEYIYVVSLFDGNRKPDTENQKDDHGHSHQ